MFKAGSLLTSQFLSPDPDLCGNGEGLFFPQSQSNNLGLAETELGNPCPGISSRWLTAGNGCGDAWTGSHRQPSGGGIVVHGREHGLVHFTGMVYVALCSSSK